MASLKCETDPGVPTDVLFLIDIADSTDLDLDNVKRMTSTLASYSFPTDTRFSVATISNVFDQKLSFTDDIITTLRAINDLENPNTSTNRNIDFGLTGAQGLFSSGGDASRENVVLLFVHGDGDSPCDNAALYRDSMRVIVLADGDITSDTTCSINEETTLIEYLKF